MSHEHIMMILPTIRRILNVPAYIYAGTFKFIFSMLAIISLNRLRGENYDSQPINILFMTPVYIHINGKSHEINCY